MLPSLMKNFLGNAFLVNDTLLTDRGKIPRMWTDHFKSLGTPSVNHNFDNEFCAIVVNRRLIPA